jgi:hypothetical protein
VKDTTRIGESENGGKSTSSARNQLSLADRELIDRLNRGYICPSDAGPAWREAYEAGIDMGLIENALQMSPQDRLRAHQRALNLVLEIVKARPSYDSGS